MMHCYQCNFFYLYRRKDHFDVYPYKQKDRYFITILLQDTKISCSLTGILHDENDSCLVNKQLLA